MHIQFRSEPVGQQVLTKALPVEAIWRTAAANVPYDACVTCVIPCLNECENLRVLLPLLRSRLAALCTGWEIIVADDGSTDGTEALMAEWTQYDGFRYVQLSRNFGKEAALSAGLESATGDAIICLDADMQHPPALIEQMLARWAAGAEMVYAVRETRADESWLKRTGARWFYKLLSGARGVEVPAHAGDFRLMSRNVVDALNALPERTRFMKGLYAWVGFKGEALPYTPTSACMATAVSGACAWRVSRWMD